MTLYFHVDVALSEDVDKTFNHCTTCSFAIFHQGCRKWAFLAASQADKPSAVFFEFGWLRRTFLLSRFAQLEARYQLAKVLIPLAVFHQERIVAAVCAADFRASMALKSQLFHRREKARRGT